MTLQCSSPGAGGRQICTSPCSISTMSTASSPGWNNQLPAANGSGAVAYEVSRAHWSTGRVGVASGGGTSSAMWDLQSEWGLLDPVLPAGRAQPSTSVQFAGT